MRSAEAVRRALADASRAFANATAPKLSSEGRAGPRCSAVFQAPPTRSLTLQGAREAAERCGTSEGRRKICRELDTFTLAGANRLLAWAPVDAKTTNVT